MVGVQLDRVDVDVPGVSGAVAKRAIADPRRDETAEGEHERGCDQLGPEANYRTPPGGSV